MANQRTSKTKTTASKPPVAKRGRPPKRAKTVPQEVDPVQAGPSQDQDIDIPSQSPTPPPIHREGPSVVPEDEPENISIRFVQGLLGKSSGARKRQTKRKTDDLYLSDSISSGDPTDDNTQPESFNLDFEVPMGANASEVHIFASDISWNNFVEEIAEIMNIRRSEVNLAYRFSSWPAKQRSHILNKQSHLVTLFEAAAKLLAGKKKEFHVVLDDQSKNSNDKKSRGDGKKRSGAKPTAASSKRRRANSNSGDGSESDSATVRKKGVVGWIAEIREQHHCAEHSRMCVKFAPDHHVELSLNDINHWAMLMDNGAHDSVIMPPPSLKLTDASRENRRQPSRTLQAPAASNSVQPIVVNIPPYYGHQPFSPKRHKHHSYEIGAPKNTRRSSPPSSDSFTFAETPSMYPRIALWLQELDNGDRGIDDYNFHQYGPAFDTHGYRRLDQLRDESVSEASIEKLAERCQMPIGVAKLLSKYAKADCSRIRAAEKQKWAAGRT